MVQAAVDMLLAKLYLNAGVYTGTPQYANALELDPDNPMVHEDLGNALEQKWLFAEAIEAWRRAMMPGGFAIAEVTSSVRGGFPVKTTRRIIATS